MIAIDRGDEPDALMEERERRLARAALGDVPAKRDDFAGYDPDEVREQLAIQQDYKCAYCEHGIEETGYPIEHFRPKLGAEDVRWDALSGEEPPQELEKTPWSVDRARYWWLAWSWENLFYSCQACNSQTHKGNRFPLRRGSPRLPTMDPHSRAEQPLLLDPAEVDPLDHIRFIPDEIEGNWRPIGLTLEGKWTIRVFGLATRPGLRTRRKSHVESIRDDHDYKLAMAAMARDDGDTLRIHWRLAVTKLLDPSKQYLALTWSVLDNDVPEDVRARHGLELPRPGKSARRAPKPLLPERPHLAGLPDDLAMRVRALRRHAPREEVETLLMDVCRHCPSTLGELCAMLRRTGAYLKTDFLERLCGTDPPRLAFDAGTNRYSAR